MVQADSPPLDGRPRRGRWRYVVAGLLLVVGLSAGVICWLGWRWSERVKGEYFTSFTIRNATVYVQQHAGEWPKRWADIGEGQDYSSYTVMRFDLTADDLLRNRQLIFEAIRPVRGSYVMYPHAREELQYLLDEIVKAKGGAPASPKASASAKPAATTTPATAKPPTAPPPPATPGLVLEDGWLRSLPGQDLGLGAIRPPDEEDRAFAQKLAPGIRDLGIEYLKQHEPKSGFALSAARQVGDFILLCYAWQEGADGDAFLVYSVKSEKIVGFFCWYEQG